MKKRAEAVGAVAEDMNGQKHFIGVWERDGRYQNFITQGAKRYAYIDEKGKMGVTVAGVSKEINEDTGITFAVEELKTLKRFKPGMKWEKAGGTQAVYNDADDLYYQDPETGKEVHITKNVAIIPTTYVMTHSRDYALLLRDIQLYKDFRRERE